ncbi:MAG TPA: hypothetical protein H9875_00805 [Candidatus Levilactobacillus faecigallinarum]|uniref:Uncharacterized protein n=1 Tax=Candidatus Levilactobacillus faecigallinarum TaxID=2838638 RepID=A0A9D1QS30_9LACO|nr:hypothetical protein [Candidatus Levilactobacillus faecigallinarum]
MVSVDERFAAISILLRLRDAGNIKMNLFIDRKVVASMHGKKIAMAECRVRIVENSYANGYDINIMWEDSNETADYKNLGLYQNYNTAFQKITYDESTDSLIIYGEKGITIKIML